MNRVRCSVFFDLTLDSFPALSRPFFCCAWMVALATVVGCGGHGTSTLEGTIVDRQGAPVPGETVFVPGHEKLVTDASGHFSMPGVSAPYDLVILSSDSLNMEMVHGLTAMQVEVAEVWNARAPSGAPGEVFVTPLAPDGGRTSAQVTLVTPDGGVNTSHSAPDPEYLVDFESDGPFTGTVFALTNGFDVDAGSRFFYYGQKDVLVTPDSRTQSNAVHVQVPMSFAPAGVVTVQPDPPLPDGGRFFLDADLIMGGWNTGLGVAGITSTGVATIEVPTVAGLDLAVSATLDTPAVCPGTWVGSMPAGSGMATARFLAPPVPISPADGSTVALDGGLTFAWAGDARPDTGYVMWLVPDDAAGWLIWVASMSPDFTLPDFGPLQSSGMPGLTPGARYHEQVYALGGVASVQQAFTSDIVMAGFSGEDLRSNAICGGDFQIAP